MLLSAAHLDGVHAHPESVAVDDVVAEGVVSSVGYHKTSSKDIYLLLSIKHVQCIG